MRNMTAQYNILLITSDSQRTDTLGCMGSPFACSPHLDALAGQGVLFTQAHSASPVCMPARCSIMTGLHAPLHACMENGLERREDVLFFTDTLKQAGYTTLMAGKTHFGPVPPSFDIQLIAKGEKNSNADDMYARELLQRGYARSSSHPNPVPEKDCLESLIVDKTIESLEKLKKNGKPFFAFCSLLSPHSPVDPPGKWMTDSIFKGTIPPPRFRPGEWETLPESLREFCGIPNPAQNEMKFPGNIQEAQGNIAGKLGMDEMTSYRELYYRSAAYVDSLVGRLMDFLDAAGLRKNTLVIFTSDHGLQNFDHGFNDKHNYYDESFRVPFIMSLPGLLPENEKRGFASHVDIAPTVIAAAGGSCDYANGFDLFTPLARREELPRHFAAASLYGSLALVTEHWKLEHYYLDNVTRLFDRRNDPGETRDIAAVPGYAEVQASLSHALLLWRSGLTDIAALKKASGPGGPVAMRVVNRIKSEKGQNNEMKTEMALREFSR